MAASIALPVLVSPLLGTVFVNLSSLIRSEFGLVWGVNKELEKLSSLLSTIKDVLEDAEVRQITNTPIRNWLRKLKDTAYDAEDLLDEFATETALRSDQSEVTETKSNSCNNIHEVLDNSVSSCFDFKRICFRRTIAKRIKELIVKFDEIAQERSKFHLDLSMTTGNDESGVQQQQRQTSSVLGEPQVYGREEDKEYIVNQLLNNTGLNDANNDVSVCAVLGMGGLGKTTLAQMVYHDERIMNRFEIRCWVCVSENFEAKTIIRAIIESSSGGSAQDLQHLDPLQSRLQQLLSGKRFLVVLDDVWNDDQAKWDILKTSLMRCGSRGSSILITTRLESVAEITVTLPPCRPKILSEEDCWSLFKHRAFDTRNNNDNHPNLEAIGKEIVKKCRGIPLAAKALGGLLRFKRKENEWRYVRDSNIWDLPQDKADAILPALRLSYNHLPSHLRQCFAYCSLFPKDYEINREELIHLWMANGFVQSKEGMELEDVGDEVFNDLSLMSFFQEFEKDEDDNVLRCKMHDLVHDLACSIMRDECLVLEVGNENTVGSTSTRHLSLVSSSKSSSKKFPEISPHVRTLLVKGPHYSNMPAPPLQLIFSNLKCLHALDLSWTDISIVPDSIGNLKHLRYLNLSHTNITSLPNESFCSLINLQALKLIACLMLQTLPKDMWKMSNLRYLEIRYCNALTRMPIRMGKLISLQTLSLFIVGEESGRGITELQGLDHLRGELEIAGLEHVRNSIDATNANLMKKQNLLSLILGWSEEEENVLLVRVGESLQPHPNIKRLRINGFGGAKLPSWMGSFSSLPNLVEVLLSGCKRCEHLPSLGELPFLKVLEISRMDSVKCIGAEFYHGHHHRQVSFFPSLEWFQIDAMINLEEFSSPSLSSLSPSSSGSSNQLEKISGGGEVKVLAFPCLIKLNIQSCPKLKTLRKEFMENLTALTDLTIKWCDGFIYLPEGMQYLSSLRNFTIRRCGGLKYLAKGLRHLTTLEKLNIGDCPQLEFLPEDDDGFQHLISLRDLHLSGLPKMTSLPTVAGWSQHHLTVPTVLESLYIHFCSGLTTLPEWIPNLKSLRHLWIWNCHPDLHRRCEEDTGDDWYKIAHIPRLENDHDIIINQSIISLMNLQTLKLRSCCYLQVLPKDMWKMSNLRHLYIRGCFVITRMPIRMEKLISLQTLSLFIVGEESGRGITELPSLDELPFLKVLEIYGMDSVKCISDMFYHGDHHRQVSFFPSLERLHIGVMINLEETSTCRDLVLIAKSVC